MERTVAICDDSSPNLRERASESLHGASKIKAMYESNRRTGRRRVGREAQVFVQSFAHFMHAYSGIIELLRRSGDVYSEVAYESLSILFIVSHYPMLEGELTVLGCNQQMCQ